MGRATGDSRAAPGPRHDHHAGQERFPRRPPARPRRFRRIAHEGHLALSGEGRPRLRHRDESHQDDLRQDDTARQDAHPLDGGRQRRQQGLPIRLLASWRRQIDPSGPHRRHQAAYGRRGPQEHARHRPGGSPDTAGVAGRLDAAAYLRRGAHQPVPHHPRPAGQRRRRQYHHHARRRQSPRPG